MLIGYMQLDRAPPHILKTQGHSRPYGRVTSIFTGETDMRALLRVSVLFILCLATTTLSMVSAQVRPDFSGTWRFASRTVAYPLTVQQSSDTLTIEARGLPQGPPTEVFSVDGSHRTTVLNEHGYWRRYDTSGRWENDTFIGTVTATAGWADTSTPDHAKVAVPHTICTRTMRLTPDGSGLSIRSHCYSPEQGGGDGERQEALFTRR
jgi:hypothetical protein